MTDLTDGTEAILALLNSQRQTNRLLRLQFPNDDAPYYVMLANRLDASEALSRDFSFTVEVISTNARIALKDVQGKNVTVSLVRGDGTLRHFNGYVFEFRQIRTNGALTYYDMVLMPWLAYLKLRRDNYLFHGKNVLEQTEDIFGDYDIRDWATDIKGEVPPVTDACQYDESDYNYLHRRWEALGWHYWYEHREDGHTLVLSDSTLRAQPIDGASPGVPWQADTGSLDEDGISDWTPVRRIVPAKVAISSFNFKNPKPTHVDVPTLNQQGDVLPVEVYEYEGAYGFKDGASGDELARRRMEEIEASGKHFEALGNNRQLQPGRWYRLLDHYDAGELGEGEDAGKFLVLEVRHQAANNYEQASGTQAYYGNRFRCIRKAIPWRPGRGLNSVEPRIYGLQTAIVVGPPGSEIHTDEYGRVRVQFHWDREGKNNEKSSAWIRVASTWSGNGYGFVGIPRVGQEVVVQFLDGNPDRPLVTACLFNEHNKPPFGLPGGAHKTGFQTRSTPGGGGLCEIVIHDDAGKELINVLSQKDMAVTTLNNHSTVVQGPQQTIAVTKGTQATTVKKAITVASETEGIQHVAHTAYEVNAQTQHIMLQASTDIILKVGQSTLHMSQDGSILLEGVNVTVKGSGKVDVNP
jgi:type VI secretion system secreted protein VgrG